MNYHEWPHFHYEYDLMIKLFASTDAYSEEEARNKVEEQVKNILRHKDLDDFIDDYDIVETELTFKEEI